MAQARGSGRAEEKALTPWRGAVGVWRLCRVQAADVVQLSSGCWCSAGAGKSATGHVRNPWAKELVVGALQWLLGGGSGDWFQRLSQ